MRDPSFDTSDYRGSRATREPKETFEVHYNPNVQHNWHCQTRYQWQMRHWVSDRSKPIHPDLRRVRDLRDYGVEAVSRWEMVNPDLYQDRPSFFPVAAEIVGRGI